MKGSLTSIVAKNTFIQTLGKALGLVLGVFTVAVLFRYLGQSGYGEFTTAITYLSLFATIVDFGLTLTTVQMISEPQANEKNILGNLLAIRIVTGLILFSAAPIIALLLPYSGEVKLAIAVGAGAYFLSSGTQMLVGVFQKRLLMWRVTLAEIANRVIFLVGSIVTVALDGGLMAVVAALIVGNVVQAVLTFALADRFVPLRFQMDFTIWKDIFHRSWPIGISIFFNVIYLRGDIFFLSLFRSADEVGIYGGAYKIIDVVTAIPVMFMGLVLPILVAAWKDANQERFQSAMQKSFDFFAILGLPLSVGAFALAEPLMVLIAGEEFRASGPILALLSPTLAVIFFGALYGHAIVAIQKQKPLALGYALVAALSVAAYLFLVPRFGAEGAAWVTLLSESTILLITFVVVGGVARAWPHPGIFFRSVIACAAMYGVLVATMSVHVLLQVGIGAVVFFAALALMGGVNRQTVRSVLPL